MEGTGKTVDGTVLSLAAADESGMVAVRAALAGGGALKPGQSVRVTAELSRRNHASCLPVGAIHSDTRGDYVLAMEERQTVLGIENVLVRVPGGGGRERREPGGGRGGDRLGQQGRVRE